jgi:PAS domain S-box-containing protein
MTLTFLVGGAAVLAVVLLAYDRLPSFAVAGVVAGLLVCMGIAVLRGPGSAAQAVRWQDVTPCYLSVQGPDLRIREVNELFRRDFGEGVDLYCYKAYKRRSEPCPDCPVLKTFADGKVHSSEEMVVNTRGEVADVLVTAAPFSTHGGRVTAVVEMSTNVTSLKDLQRELARSRQEYRHLFEVVPCYITVQGPDYKIVQSNALFRQDFGEDVGWTCYHAYKDRQEVCTDCPVAATFTDGQIHQSEETVVTRDGRRVSLIVYSTPIIDEQGRVRAVMEVSTDITQVKALQQQLAVVGLAVSGMAHRIKNVMMGLEGGVFVVNTGMEDNDQVTVKRGWEMVQRNAQKISRIARDLLFCAKEHAPRPVAGTSPRAIVLDTAELYRERIARDGIALEVEVGHEDDGGSFDPEAISNLVANLITNAIDACRFDESANKQHRIQVRCRTATRGVVLIEVEDNGAGISQEDHGRVFDGFFSTKGAEGTGLGLLVVQKVAREHGGDVSFDSAPGRGSTFRVRLQSINGAAPPPS